MINKTNLTMGQKVFKKVFNNSDICLYLSVMFKIHGNLDKERFEKAINQTIKDADILRVRVNRDKESGDIYQYFDSDVRYKLKTEVVQGQSYDEKYAKTKMKIKELLEVSEEEALNDALQWDIVLFELEKNEYVFHMRINHLVFDGASSPILVNRLVSNYNGVQSENGADFKEFVKDEIGFEGSDEYTTLLKEAEPVIQNIKDYRALSFPGKGKKLIAQNKEFLVLDCGFLTDFCKENKISLFHACLFFYHSAIAATYNTNKTLIVVPVGTRKAKYRNTAGYLVSLCANTMVFEDALSVKDNLIKCRDSFYRDSKITPVIYESIVRHNVPVEFILTYQSYIADFKVKIPLGDAFMEPMADYDIAFTEGGGALESAAITAMESKSNIFLSIRAAVELFPEEIQESLKKAFVLISECITKENMTFGEFRKEFAKIKS